MLEFRTLKKIPRFLVTDCKAITQIGMLFDHVFDDVTPDYRLMARLVHVVERLDRPTNRLDMSVQNLDFAFNGPVASVVDQLAMLDHEAFRRFGGPVRHVGLLAISASIHFKTNDKANGDAMFNEVHELLRQGVDEFPFETSSSRIVAGITSDGWQLEVTRDEGAKRPRALVCDPSESIPRGNDMLDALRPLNDQLKDVLLHQPDRFTMDPQAYAQRSARPHKVKRPTENSATFGSVEELVPSPMIEATILRLYRMLF